MPVARSRSESQPVKGQGHSRLWHHSRDAKKAKPKSASKPPVDRRPLWMVHLEDELEDAPPEPEPVKPPDSAAVAALLPSAYGASFLSGLLKDSLSTALPNATLQVSSTPAERPPTAEQQCEHSTAGGAEEPSSDSLLDSASAHSLHEATDAQLRSELARRSKHASMSPQQSPRAVVVLKGGAPDESATADEWAKWIVRHADSRRTDGKISHNELETLQPSNAFTAWITHDPNQLMRCPFAVLCAVGKRRVSGTI